MKLIILLLSLFICLAGCNFDLTPTFYVRDIQDVISDKQEIEIPIFVKLPSSDVDSCQAEIGQVLGILETYQIKGTLQSCSSDEVGMFAFANVKFTASLVWSEGQTPNNFSGIVALAVEQTSRQEHYLSLYANPKLPSALDDIENALFFATLDASQVGFEITLNNDTRREFVINIYDSFVNGVPTDYGTFQVGPRSELQVRSSNVLSHLFFNRGWFTIGDFEI